MVSLFMEKFMKVLIYDNKGKDVNGVCLKKLTNLLCDANIEYALLEDCDLNKNAVADAIFTIGGDGTILWLTEFSNRNEIPIIGINAGKLGFLSEFEIEDMNEAVNLFKEKLLGIDERLTLKVTVNGKSYHALNDAYVQRLYSKDIGCLTAELSVEIDGTEASKLTGDGVVVCTPTGSTAYSLSAGGPILSPKINALSITPIAAHGLSHRPIVFSADSICKLSLTGKALGTLFVDGKYITEIKKGDVISIERANKYTKFLRKNDFDFYKRLSVKLKDNLNLE